MNANIIKAETSKLYLPKDPFEGNFRTLLPLLRDNPYWVSSGKATLERLILREGINEARTDELRRLHGSETLLAFNAFRDFFGIEASIYAFVKNYLGAAVEGHGADKQAPLFVGPPGSGKSDAVAAIKKIWRKGEPMPELGGSQHHENPLNLLFMVPRVAVHQAKGKNSLAPGFAAKIVESLNLVEVIDWTEPQVKELVAKHGLEKDSASIGALACADVDEFVSLVVYGLGLPKSTRNNIGLPSPAVQSRLYGTHGRAVTEIADYEMGVMLPALGHGIVDVPEVDPLQFNIATWVGRKNVAKIGKVADENPDVVQLNGYFNRGSRGIVILTEGLKNTKESWRILLEALQGRRMPLPEPLAAYHEDGLFFEGLILIHTNEAEYRDFLGDVKNEPYWDRVVPVDWKYPLEVSQAAKVSRKMYNNSNYSRPVDRGGVHVEPILFDYESAFRVLSYLEADPNGVPSLVKMDAYDGKQVRSTGMGTVIEVVDLRARASIREGMEGISPRLTAEKVIGALAQEAKDLYVAGKRPHPCVTSRDFRDRMYDVLRKQVADPKKRNLLKGFLDADLETWRRKKLSKFVRAAFLESFSKECQDTFDKYVEWSNASVLGQTPKTAGYSRVTRTEMEEWLRKLENQPGFQVTSGQVERFRREVQAAVTRYVEDNGVGKRVPYTVHRALQECIERFVLAAVTDVVRIISESTARGNEDQKKLEGARGRLITEHNFCPHCANALFEEVSRTRNFIIE